MTDWLTDWCNQRLDLCISAPLIFDNIICTVRQKIELSMARTKQYIIDLSGTTESITCGETFRDRVTEREIKSDTECTEERIKRQNEKAWSVCVRDFKCVSSKAPVDHLDTCLSISVTLMSLWKFCRLVQHSSWCRADPSQQNTCNIKR